MTKEDKELLIKDLGARLPHGVVLRINKVVIERLHTIDNHRHTANWFINGFNIDAYEVKPYLRPLLSMTEEEIHEFQEILGSGIEVGYGFVDILDSSIHTFSFNELQALFDWLNTNHFDYRGLIPKGLAIEINKNNNPYKE